MPKNWVNCELREVVFSKKGKKPSSVSSVKKDGFMPYLLIDEMEGGEPRSYTNDKKVIVANENDVLVVWDGSIGKTVTGLTGAIGSTIVSLSPIMISSKYLESFIKFKNQYIHQTSKGTGLQHINQDYFWTMPFPLAPLNEQRRIEDKLNKLMARVSDSKERLEKAKILLERFKQSLIARVLKKYNLSENYGQIKDVITDIRYGTSKKCNTEVKGLPVLRIPNIINGEVSHNKLKYAEFNEAEKKKLKLEEGDILIIRSNGSVSLVGRAALVSEKEKGFLFAGYLIRLRLDKKKLNPEFLNLVLGSYGVRYQIELPARSTSGVNNINSQEVKALRIPLPTLPEQDKVVKEIKDAVNVIKIIEEKYLKAKSFTDKISNSIYAKAFRGELVDQDPNDEPADVLLEKIKKMKKSK